MALKEISDFQYSKERKTSEYAKAIVSEIKQKYGHLTKNCITIKDLLEQIYLEESRQYERDEHKFS